MKNDSIFTVYPDSTFRFTSGFPFNTSITPIEVQRHEIQNNLPYQTVILIDETDPEWLKEDFGYFMNTLVKTVKATNEVSGNYLAFGFYSRNTFGANLNVKYIEDCEKTRLCKKIVYNVDFQYEYGIQIRYVEIYVPSFHPTFYQSMDHIVE